MGYKGVQVRKSGYPGAIFAVTAPPLMPRPCAIHPMAQSKNLSPLGVSRSSIRRVQRRCRRAVTGQDQTPLLADFAADDARPGGSARVGGNEMVRVLLK